MERTPLIWWYVDAYYKGKLHDTRRFEFATEAKCVANDVNSLKDWKAKIRKVVEEI